MVDGPTSNDEFVELTINPEDEAEAQAAQNAEGEKQDAKPEGDDKQPETDKSDEKYGDQPDDGRLRHPDGRFRRDEEARIHRLTFQLREAERQRDAANARLNGAQVGDAPAKPTPDKYEDYGDYVEALTDWKVDQRARAAAADNAKTAGEAVDTHRQAVWTERVAAAALPDFSEVVGKSEIQIAPHVGAAILDADRGPEIAYYLAKNEAVVDKLNDMSPARAAIELGKIEANLTKPAEAPKPRETRTSTAPAPITPVQPGSTTAKDPSKMDMDEYLAFRKEAGVR